MSLQPDEVYQHTSGATTGFKPNMSQEEVAELDRRRGMGDMGPYTNPDVIVNKKPWIDPQGVHKAEGKSEPKMSKMQEAAHVLKSFMAGMPFGKPMPERRPGESVAERDVRHHMEHKDEHPGGAKQAIAIGLNQAREAGASVPAKKSHDCDDDKDHEKNEAREIADFLFGDHKKDVDKGKSPAQEQAQHAASERSSQRRFEHKEHSIAQREALRATRKGDIGGGVMPAPTSLIGKALSSRSMYIPRPVGPYDPFGIERAATAIPVHGGALTETARPVHQETALKSCALHGISYRAEAGCHPCNVQKSQTCASCGNQLVKSFGGALVCERCH